MKKYDCDVFRILNQWQVTLMVSHDIKPIDMYVSVNGDGKYNLVYVFNREHAISYIESFREHTLTIGDSVTEFAK